MSLDHHLDDMIVLYTLDEKSLRDIGDRFGCSKEFVRQALIGAGVTLRGRGFRKGEADDCADAPASIPETPPVDLRAECFQPQPGPLPVARRDVIEARDAAHVNAVIRALGGYPFYDMTGGR